MIRTLIRSMMCALGWHTFVVTESIKTRRGDVIEYRECIHCGEDFLR